MANNLTTDGDVPIDIQIAKQASEWLKSLRLIYPEATLRDAYRDLESVLEGMTSLERKKWLRYREIDIKEAAYSSR